MAKARPTIIRSRIHVVFGYWYVMDNRKGYWTDYPPFAKVFESRALARAHATEQKLSRVDCIDPPTKGETDET